MAKVRVHELAKELGVESKVVLTKLKEMGEFVKSASSTVEPPVVKRFTDRFGAELKAAPTKPSAKKTTTQQGSPSAQAAVPRLLRARALPPRSPIARISVRLSRNRMRAVS